MTEFRVATVIALIAAAALHADVAQGQSVPIELHGYAGLALPRGGWTETNTVDNGFGYGANVVVRPLSFVGIYGGWDRFSFGFDNNTVAEETEIKISSSGIRAGIELSLPIEVVAPFVSAGLFFGQGELEIAEMGTTYTFRSTQTLGYEMGVGFDIPLGPVGLRPRVGYRSHETDLSSFAPEVGPGKMETSHLNLTIGIFTGR